LGKKLATGGFGTVFKADLIDDEDKDDVRSVIVKKVSAHSGKLLHVKPLLPLRDAVPAILGYYLSAEETLYCKHPCAGQGIWRGRGVDE